VRGPCPVQAVSSESFKHMRFEIATNKTADAFSMKGAIAYGEKNDIILYGTLPFKHEK
jgi:hypothetical protein